MKRHFSPWALLALLSAPLLFSGSAHGSTSNWINPGVGNWFNSMNWDNNVPNDTAVINNGGTAQYSVILPIIGSLEVGTNAGTNTGHLQVFGGPGVVFNVSGVEIGDSLGVGTLEVSGGAEFKAYDSATIGRTATTSSSVTVTGSGSKWTTIPPLLTINGILDVNNLAVVSGNEANIGANGRLTVASSATVTFGRVVNAGLVQVGSGGTGAILQTNLINNGTLEFNHTSSYTHVSPVSGAGPIRHMNSGSTTMTNVASVSGDVTVNGGQLVLQNALNAKSYTVNGGTLRFDNATTLLSHPTAAITSGTTAEYLGSTITGGYLRGNGTHRVVAGNISRFNGLTAVTPTKIVQDGTAAFDLFTNGGLFTNNGVSTFTSTTNAAGGQIILNGIVDAADFVNNGVLTVNSGTTLNNFNSNLVNGGGSRTTVNSGAAINLNGTQLDLNGALLVNNGTISNGAVNVYFGSLAKGAGTYGTVNVFDGGKFSPGNSPGVVNANSLNLNEAGRLVLEIRDIAGAPGIGYDRINLSSNLNFNAGTTPNSKLTIELATLDAANQPGLAANFNPTLPFSLPVFAVGGTIGGYSASEVAFDLSGFKNNLAGGSFSLTSTAGGMSLSFLPAAGLPGDYNNDQVVNAADYTLWRNKLGSATALANDNTPGVGQDDLERWQLHFGEKAGGAGGLSLDPSAVPEPSALASIAVMVSLTANCFRRRGSPRLKPATER